MGRISKKSRGGAKKGLSLHMYMQAKAKVLVRIKKRVLGLQRGTLQECRLKVVLVGGAQYILCIVHSGRWF